ncbi:putative efflux transporter [Metarhizium acridum CQMa 102]|uniref:Putative efflux transporter n=1 Tax=Metarhizium acridum (strain CQMa 102) TaxID=655827 RepID=E9DZK7_METAQ|nr:putative efflux transporter [Metarhizium acridum CQMa 102]EFY90939.1 putative efflux transporter [Metarhizium acridum CQMa 102]
MGSGPPTTEKDTTSRSRRGRADSDANNTRTVSVHANQDDSDAGLERNEPDGEDGNGDLPMSKARCIALVATVTGAAFLNVLNIQSVVIILPTIGRHLDIPEGRLQWIVSSYSLAFGCFLLLWGRIADIYGKRLIFILGSLLGHPLTLSCRQGAGAPLGSVCGNLLSGLIAEYANWKWVFGALAILSAVITAAGVFLIPPRPPAPPPSDTKSDGSVCENQPPAVDWLGAALITTALLALNLSLTEGNVVGWATAWVPVILITFVLLVALFALWQIYLERRHARGLSRAPLIKISVFRNRRDFQGLSPLNTMLRYIPTGVTGVLVALIVAKLLSRIPTLFILVCGTLATSVACLLYAVPIPPTTTYWAYGFPAMVLAVVGADTSWPCLTLFTSQALPREDQAIGGALINAVGQFGRSVGLAVGTAIQTAAMAKARGVIVKEAGPIRQWDGDSLTGLRATSWVNFAFGMASLLVVVTAFRSMDIIGKPRSAATLVRDESGRGVVSTENSSNDLERTVAEKN